MSPHTLLYLSRSDVEGLALPMADVIDAVEGAFREKGTGTAEMPPKPGVHPGPDAFIHAMPAYLKEMRAYHTGVKPEPASYPTKVTRSLVEEFSGKKFEYEEILPIFENYTPDPKAADVSADTRALADVCLLLLNSHEFVHVY